MATWSAIAATTNALETVFRNAAAASGGPALKNLQVKPYRSSDLQNTVLTDTDLTLSIFLYRVCVSAGLRNVPLEYANGEPLQPPVPVDLFYLITAWARDPTVQQQLLGWAIRALQDTSTLPSTLLNDGPWAGVFAPSDAVEMVWHPLTMQEEYDVWQIAQTNQQPSASYVARTVAIDSTVPIPLPPLAQTRELQYGAQAT